jgi:hypothetical protein
LDVEKNRADKTGKNRKANRKALRENQKIGLSGASKASEPSKLEKQ